jgi:peptidoglycan L-alanyl-D-glutamate endopeptidase CwlK
VIGAASIAKLASCHRDLQRLVIEADKVLPPNVHLVVITGHRNKADQDAAYVAGKSEKKWPESKHNKIPSEAVDLALAVYDQSKGRFIDWNDWATFGLLAGVVMATAHRLAIRVRWGADWDQDWWTREHKLRDGPHFELLP